MARIAQNIERYNLAYRLAWKHIPELQKREYPNVPTFLHDDIRRQLKEGAVEPVLIASEALRYIERLTGQLHSDEEPPIPVDDRKQQASSCIEICDRPSILTTRKLECALEVPRARAAKLVHVATMSHGVAGSDWKSLELKGNSLQHVRHE